jgi:hypothetical protein
MKTNYEIINELRGALKEAIDVFDRPTHQIETSFPEFSAMRRMKDALGTVDMNNIKLKSEAKHFQFSQRKVRQLK